MRCDHRRIKKNYPFGKRSTPTMFCKRCGEVVTPHDLMLKRREKSLRHKQRRGR